MSHLVPTVLAVQVTHGPMGVIRTASLVVAVSWGVYLLVRFLTSDVATRESQWVLRWSGVALAAGVLAGYLVAESATLTAFLGPDARGYHRDGVMLAESWAAGEEAGRLGVGAAKHGFSYLLGAVYWVAGPARLHGVVLNAALSAALVPLIWDVTRRFAGVRPAYIVCPLVAVLPAFVIWPAQLLREAPILFLMAVAVAAAWRLIERTTPLAVVVLVSALALLGTLRGYVGVVLGAGLLLALVVQGGVSPRQRRMVLSAAVGVTALAAVAVLVVGIGTAGVETALEYRFDDIERYRRALAREQGSAVDPDVDLSTAAAVAAYLPRGLANLLLGPFPWQVPALRHVVGFIDALVWLALTPALLYGLRGSWVRRDRSVLLLLVPAIGLSLMFAVVMSNYGIILRQRAQVWLLLMPLVAAGLAALTSSRRRRTPVTLASDPQSRDWGAPELEASVPVGGR